MTSSESCSPTRIFLDGRGASRWLFPLFLVLATIIAYMPAWHAGFVWDDEKYITADPDLLSLHGLYRIWFEPRMQYYPLTFTTFWFEYHLWGFHAAGYHIVNIVLHGVDAVLLWVVLRRLKVPGAWLASAIFALHPVNVESVAWIVERKNTLSTAFYLCSIMAAMKFWLPDHLRRSRGNETLIKSRSVQSSKLQVQSETPHVVSYEENEGRSRGDEALNKIESLQSSESAAKSETPDVVSYGPLTDWKYYWLAFGLFVLALLGKTTTIPLPAVILLLVWWKRGRITASDVKPTIPFFAAGIAMGFITRWAEARLEAPGEGLHIHLVDRFLIAGRNLWFYIGKLVWPHPLIPIYPQWHIDPSSVLNWLPLLGVVVVLAILWFARKTWGRPVFVALAYFAGMLFTVLGFFNVSFFHYSFVSDHFLYLACMGPFALFAAALTLAMAKSQVKSETPHVVSYEEREGRSRGNETLTKLESPQSSKSPDQSETPYVVSYGYIIVSACLLAILATLTWRQCRIYADNQSFWGDTVAHNPNTFLALNNLGDLYLKSGHVEAAVDEFQKSIAVHPDPMIYHNLGYAMLQLGKPDQALLDFKKSVQADANFGIGYADIGNFELQSGHTAEAIQELQKAYALKSDFPPFSYSLGNAYAQNHDLDHAIDYWEKTVALNPEMAEAQNNLANALVFKHRVREAIQHWKSALAVQPDMMSALVNLGWVLSTCGDASLRDGATAVKLVEHANQLTGGANPLVQRALAAALAEDGKYADAVATARQALLEARANPQLAATLQAQLKFYENNQPYRDPGLQPSPFGR